MILQVSGVIHVVPSALLTFLLHVFGSKEGAIISYLWYCYRWSIHYNTHNRFPCTFPCTFQCTFLCSFLCSIQISTPHSSKFEQIVKGKLGLHITAVFPFLDTIGSNQCQH